MGHYSLRLWEPLARQRLPQTQAFTCKHSNNLRTIGSHQEYIKNELVKACCEAVQRCSNYNMGNHSYPKYVSKKLHIKDC
jgi:hypothetical protein